MFMMDNSRWEVGSFFHWIPEWQKTPSPAPWEKNCVFYGKGRDTIRGLMLFGQATHGWKRLWFPSYFCQEVLRDIVFTCQSIGMDVHLYEDSPIHHTPQVDMIDAKPGDVLFRVNFFGMRSTLSTPSIDRSLVEVIDDHTHDPWSDWAWSDDADWCTASFRKTLPVPCGAVLWSPKGYELPNPPPVSGRQAFGALSKFAAMSLKGSYLAGHPIPKEVFRELAFAGEDRISTGEISGMPEWISHLLPYFPAESWRKKRLSNHKVFCEALADVPWLKVMLPDDLSLTCPFAGIVVCDTPERRDFIREQLIARNIYPTILWKLDNPVLDDIPPEHHLFSRRMFTIHCDTRYSAEDMIKAASFIRKIGESMDNDRPILSDSDKAQAALPQIQP